MSPLGAMIFSAMIMFGLFNYKKLSNVFWGGAAAFLAYMLITLIEPSWLDLLLA
jgi:hypothetical protein